MSKQEVAIKNRRARDRALKRGINRPRESRLARGLIAAAPAPFFVFALVLGLGFIGAGTAYAYFAQDLPAAADFSKDPLPLSTKVYARDGTTLLYEFAEERREPVRYDELPQTLIDATIAAEDKTFWTNPGVDVSGIARAVYYDIFRRGDTRPQGASKLTLAQQALLAGLPQAPSELDPTKDENLSRALDRRSYVLDQMVDNGYITS